MLMLCYNLFLPYKKMDSRESYVMHTALPLVLDYLPWPDKLRCAQVCTLWNNVVQQTLSWGTLNLENYRVNLADMFTAISKQHHSVVNLRIINCTLDTSCFDLYIPNETQIQKLELSEVPSVFLNTVTSCLPNLKVLKARCCPSYNVRLDLSIFTTMAYPRVQLTELKLYCNRGIDNLDKLLLNLGEIRHLYLLGLKSHIVKTESIWESLLKATQRMHFKNDVLESFGLDLEELPPHFHMFLKKFVRLKKLRLENCRKWDCKAVLTELSSKPTFTHLELIEVNIPINFTSVFPLCSNITCFTIVLNTPRFHLEQFIADVVVALKPLSSTLKNLTWGFSDRYLYYIRSKTGMVVVERLDPSSIYGEVIEKTLGEFRSELEDLLPKTEIVIKTCMNEGNIFD